MLPDGAEQEPREQTDPALMAGPSRDRLPAGPVLRMNVLIVILARTSAVGDVTALVIGRMGGNRQLHTWPLSCAWLQRMLVLLPYLFLLSYPHGAHSE